MHEKSSLPEVNSLELPGPQTTPNPTDTPEDEDCPLNLRVSQQPPTLNAGKIGSEHPVVVGQDPTKRGVDVSASIVIHPVIVKYDVPKSAGRRSRRSKY